MKRILTLLVGMLFLSLSASAQNGESPISYKSLAQQFSTFNVNGDAEHGYLTSVSSFNGYGSYMDNPAAMALAESSFYSISLFSNTMSIDNTYQGNANTEDNSNLYFGNIGLVYKVPTAQGSLVFGGGYSLVSHTSDEMFLDAYNNDNTITDMFKAENSNYNGIAFDAFAIDYGDNSETYFESIFRIGLSPDEYRGIQQYATITNTRNMGEITFFGATEFQKNLYAGLNLSIYTGTHRFDRNFQEVDSQNQYDDGILFADDQGNNGTDIHSIELVDDIDSEMYGFGLSGGIIFKMLPSFHIGSSFTLPTKFFISESYYSNIDTEFDDNSVSTDNNYAGSFDYSITKPAKLNLGATVNADKPLNFSVSAEYIDYSTTKVKLVEDEENLTPEDIAALKANETEFNNQIRDEYAAVVKFKSHAVYTFKSGTNMKAGYAYLPSKKHDEDFSERIYTLGITFPVNPSMSLNFLTQYSARNDRSVVYDYEDINGNRIEVGNDQSIESLKILGGIKVHF